jgi:hypothetical protein
LLDDNIIKLISEDDDLELPDIVIIRWNYFIWLKIEY